MTEPAGNTLTHSDGRARKPGAPAPRPYLFLVMLCESPLSPPARFALHEVDAVTIGRGSERSTTVKQEGETRRLVIRVPDPWMSATHATLTRVLGRWVLEDQNSRNGTLVNGEAQQRVVLGDEDLIELGHSFLLYRDAIPTLGDDAAEAARGPSEGGGQHAPAPGLSTMLPTLAREFTLLEQVARSTVSVVLRGESGTGKEVVARAVHQVSGRGGPFVAVNCGALPETLVETELFGYRKGAFSGASEDRPGLVRSSDGGTLFLDEIGDLPLPSQAAFLRVLQEREVMPIGGTRTVKVDLRLVAATHRDLDSLVEEGKFRADLLARISGFTVTLPPLGERREDLGLIVAVLLKRVAPPGVDPAGITFHPDAARALFRHDWPLNVRELEKCLTTAVVLAGGGRIELLHLPDSVRSPQPRREPTESKVRALSEAEQRHRDELVALFKEHDGNISAVARVLGKARMQVQRWVKRYGVDPQRFRR